MILRDKKKSLHRIISSRTVQYTTVQSLCVCVGKCVYAVMTLNRHDQSRQSPHQTLFYSSPAPIITPTKHNYY